MLANLCPAAAGAGVLAGTPRVRGKRGGRQAVVARGAFFGLAGNTGDEEDEDEYAEEDEDELVGGAWFEAVRAGDLAAAQELLDSGDEVSGVDATDDEFDAFNGKGRTALHVAARAGHTEVVSWLLEEGADPLHADYWDGCSALHEAAACGARGAVRALLASGADVDARILSDRSTPLHSAAWAGSEEVWSLLVEARADPQAEDASGRTPLDIARAARQLSLIGRDA